MNGIPQELAPKNGPEELQGTGSTDGPAPRRSGAALTSPGAAQAISMATGSITSRFTWSNTVWDMEAPGLQAVGGAMWGYKLHKLQLLRSCFSW